MEETASATLNHILLAAMEEFSDKGFLGASLRQLPPGRFMAIFPARRLYLPLL